MRAASPGQEAQPGLSEEEIMGLMHGRGAKGTDQVSRDEGESSEGIQAEAQGNVQAGSGT